MGRRVIREGGVFFSMLLLVYGMGIEEKGKKEDRVV